MPFELTGEYRLLAEAIPQIVWSATVRGRAAYFNTRWFEYTGMTLERCLGDGWQAAVHPDDLPPMLAKRRETLASGDLFDAEFRIRRYDGAYRWFLARAVPLRSTDGRIVKWFGTCTDIHDQKRAEDILRILAQLGRSLGESLDPSLLMHNLAHAVVPALADYCQVVAVEGEVLRPLAIAHARPAHADLLRRIHERFPLRTTDPAVAAMLRAGEPVFMPEVTDAMLLASAPNPEHYELLRALGLRSALVVPLRAHGRSIGAISFGCVSRNRRLHQSELPLYAEIAHRAAAALENALRYQREHHVAKTLQEAILPRDLPVSEGTVFTSAYVPAAVGVHVGGDWYDAFALPDGRVALSIGDVVGHGLDAAIVMGEIRQALRSAAIDGRDPSAALEHADRLLRMQRPEWIATAGCGIYDPRTRTIAYSTAGHPAPLVCLPTGEIRSLDAEGLPLGMRHESPGTACTSLLPPGSLTVFYTDGLTEFDRDALEGERALREAMRAEVREPSPNPALAIYRRVVVNPTHTDDTAILALRVSAIFTSG
ncbi:MAG: SpoIIE family protein phosphatase [Vulcanimicrobiaceae bacterium]